MLVWPLFAAYEGIKAQKYFSIFKLFENSFSKIAEIKLDCGDDLAPLNS